MNEVSFAESIDRLKESFLWAAAKGGNTEDCASLVEIGADINFKGTNGDTPLLAACRAGHTETVAFLLAHGADANIPGADSMAPIHVVASRGDTNTLDRILESSASTGIKTRDGMTALDIAKAKGNDSVYGRLMGNRRALNRNSASRPNVLEALPPVSSVRENLPALGNLPSVLPTPTLSLSTISSGLASNHTLPTAHDQPPRPGHAHDSERLVSSSHNNQKPRTQAQGTAAAHTSVSATIAPPKSSKTSSDSKGYSIMGDASTSSGSGSGGSTEENIALKRLLDAEISKRKAFESKLEVFTKQNKQLVEELTSLNLQLQTQETQIDSLEETIQRLQGNEKMLAAYKIEDCEALENELKASLNRVEKRKAVIIRSQIEAQKEQRLCVICQENEKTVVLLPCRHLCLCDGCSVHSALDMCPLCREAIVHKISVFS